MIVTTPMPLREALQLRQIKSLIPTTGNTAQLSALEQAIKLRAMFSATVTSAKHLQKISDLADAILRGETDLPSARLQIKDLLAEEGYQPDPETRGGLQDLSSPLRIDVQLDTNVDVARGFGWYQQGQEPLILDQWPAQELTRFSEPKGGPDAERDWHGRWAIAGGKFYAGRMIALKDDEVWANLGDPTLFPDGLGNPFPPFAFNSGMDVIDIDREEAASVGLEIPDDYTPEPDATDLNADLQASADVRAGWLRQAMEDTGLGSFTSDGVFKFAGGDN